jgi:pyruvate,water dikinase
VGFVVTTDAYRAYVTHNDLAGVIQSALDDLTADDAAALENVSGKIRGRFAADVLAPDLAEGLRRAYDELGAPPVAVRSSATAEDLPELSFAGQQDTILNVAGEEALLEAVVRCWSSLWTARAIGYRARNGIPQDDLALAVVVQEMVPSEAAGVLFTANPLNGRRTEMIVEAVLGLGEALVSGQVEPDHYLVEAASGRIMEKKLGAKALSIRPAADGGTSVRQEQAAAQQALPDEAIGELAGLGRQAARLLGTPQDVEWAWAGARMYVLQSRPITSLFPVPAGMSPDPLQVLVSFAAVQGLLDPVTPLGRDTIRALFVGAGSLFGYQLTVATQNVVHTAAERLFINVTGVIRNRLGRRLALGSLGFVEPSVQQAIKSLVDDQRLAVTGGPSLRGLRRIVSLLVPAIGRLILTLLRPETERDRFERELEARLVAAEAKYAEAATLAERVALMEELTTGAFPFVLPRFVPRFGAAMGPLNMLMHLVDELPDDEQNALALTRGLPHNVTTEMDLALWQVAREIRADEKVLAHFEEGDAGGLAAEYLAACLPDAAQAAVAGFLARYGMRGVGEIDLGRPRWREDPTPIVQTLQSYLQIEDASQAPDAVFARRAAEAETAIEQLAGRLRASRGGRFKAWRARWAARRLRALMGVREAPKFWAIRNMGLVRAALLASGRELVESGVLSQPDDLFFLSLDELRALAAGEGRDWAGLVQERRGAYAREERRKQIPRLLLSDGQAFYEGMAAQQGVDAAVTGEEGILGGSPVSPGVVEGAVHVVLDPSTARLAPGEILVCPGTDPAWTPLFLVAGGLVMEVGGLMTHGSVVAREYGIPAVVGVSQATSRLKTGQRVRVDGNSGKVKLLENGEDHEQENSLGQQADPG